VHYSYEMTFTAGTVKSKQEELEMDCAWGVLTNVVIAFAAGCHGAVHVHVDEGLHQVYPTNPKGDYAFDNYTLEIKDKYRLHAGTRKIVLKGWNEGTYDHTIHIAFEIEPSEPVSATDQAIMDIRDMLTGED